MEGKKRTLTCPMEDSDYMELKVYLARRDKKITAFVREAIKEKLERERAKDEANK